jgi:signal transduction histidine kinase
VTYLQSSQYKQLKAYRTIAIQERKERLINSITAAFRRSILSEEILSITVNELGRVFSQCRCLFYPVGAEPQPIEYESTPVGLASLKGETWALADHSLFQAALAQGQAIAIADVTQDLSLRSHSALKAQLQYWQIGACLLVPIAYQQTRLGVLELHHAEPQLWQTTEIALVEAIATQVGVALMQAQAHADSQALNQQLRDLEQTQSNLIAIVGHELRTPLSTIQVCLESLASEAEMPLEFQQIMLQTALGDTERLRRLIQDFLTLSRLESDSADWQAEPISLQECLELALSSFRKREGRLPQFTLELSHSLPLVQVDGDGLIEVFTKLLDNACKFTESQGEIIVRTQVLTAEVDNGADIQSCSATKIETKTRKRKDRKNTSRALSSTSPHLHKFLEVIIADTGRGMEPKQLETIFRQFYQEEGYLRRTVNGTGIGLAICRQMIQKWGGSIWAESAGKNQGSTFHFTLPIAALPA